MRKFTCYFVTIDWSKWNEAWDQRLEPDRIELPTYLNRTDLT